MWLSWVCCVFFAFVFLHLIKKGVMHMYIYVHCMTGGENGGNIYIYVFVSERNYLYWIKKSPARFVEGEEGIGEKHQFTKILYEFWAGPCLAIIHYLSLVAPCGLRYFVFHTIYPGFWSHWEFSLLVIQSLQHILTIPAAHQLLYLQHI